MRRSVVLLAVGVALALLLVAPRFLGPWQVGILTKVLIFAILAMSLDLLMGYAGLPSLGQSAYFGTAAYTVGLLTTRLTANFWLNLGAGLAAATLLAALFGLLALRARAVTFLMITLALAQVVWALANSGRAVTRGADGLPGIGRPDLGFLPWSSHSAANYYYFVFFFFAVTALVLYSIVRSPFGLALMGIRDNELRMRALGYNTWLHLYVAFVIAGAFAGLAGMLDVYFNSIVTPASAGVMISADPMLMIILGGPATLFGAALGAAIIVPLTEIVSVFTQHWLIVLGGLYILVMIFARQGLLGVLKSRFRVFA